MLRLTIYAAIMLVCGVAMVFASPAGAMFALLGGLAVGVVIPLLDATLLNARFLRIAWHSLRNWRKPVRLSISYLYRIKVDDVYLLIASDRFDHYQPVGGVYKAHRSSVGKFMELGVADDDVLTPDAVSERDLRVRVKGRKLLDFVQWFDSGRNREVDGWREFYEELVETGILSHRDFRYIEYDWAKRYYSPVRFSAHAGCREIFIADIFHLIPNETQLDQLRKLKASSSAKIMWATEDQIRRRGVVPGASSQPNSIAEHANWIL